jgi:adenosylcobinamide amidohydrolase
MKQFDLLGTSAKLVLKGNVLAVISDSDLTVVSSAIYNGGFRKTKAILNVQVPEGYSDRSLHADPVKLIVESSKKLRELGVSDNFVAMITAAKVTNFALCTKKEGEISVSVAATAGCQTHAESAGEEIDTQEVVGTINIIVVVDGNPTDSCLVSVLPTATEAKTAAIKDLDIRSWYSGDAATGTITDSVVAASTNKGPTINYGGPASKLGKLVGYCTRKAVKEAVMKQDRISTHRSVLKRLAERHLPLEKLASELSKVTDLGMDNKALVTKLAKILRDKPLLASLLMAAAKMDEDIKKELVPPEFGNIDALSQDFAGFFSKQTSSKPKLGVPIRKDKYESVDLSPFLKQVLISIMRNAVSEETTERLK